MGDGAGALGPAGRCFSLPSYGTRGSWPPRRLAEFMEVSLGSGLGAGRGAETSPEEDG